MKNLKINKKLISLLTAGTIVLVAGGIGASRADFFAQDDTIITTSDLNVRVSDEVESERIGGIKINQTAERILTTSNGWDLIRNNDHLGFVSGDYTQTYEDANPLYNYEEQKSEAKTNNEVNLRLGPTTDYGIITTLEKDSSISVLGKTNNGWYLVQYGNELGFLREDFVNILTYEVKEDYSLTTNTANVYQAVFALENAKIREDANENSRQLDLLKKGASIKMISGPTNGWYEIAYKNGHAYVSASLVKETIGVSGNMIKLIGLTQDTNLYDAPNGNVIGTLPAYESGEVYLDNNGYYLIKTTDNIVGYINKNATKALTNTSVVVDISSQTVRVYSNNEMVLTIPIVSGYPSEGRHSDLGIFSIYSKEEGRYLTDGETYNSYVNYWMPYNGGEGLHDATWRTRFGGDIYQNNGSHGCINMPLDMAAQVYERVSVGDNVIVKK